jgi:hypothetical protein
MQLLAAHRVWGSLPGEGSHDWCGLEVRHYQFAAKQSPVHPVLGFDLISNGVVKSERHQSAVGAKGIGEQAVIPTAPAVLIAIHDVTGVQIRQFPATVDPIRTAILTARKDPNRA